MNMKLFPRILQLAEERLAGLRSIDPALDLGNALTVASYEAEIDAFKTKLDVYNETKSSLDAQRSHLRSLESQLRDIREKVLLAVGAKFGKDSIEYVHAGGVRKSERKRPSRSLPSDIQN